MDKKCRKCMLRISENREKSPKNEEWTMENMSNPRIMENKKKLKFSQKNM